LGQKHTLALFVRHGTTTLNAENVFRGQEDAPLDRKGFQDAHKVAFFLKGWEFCHCFCSDRKRSLQTAEIVGKAINCNPIPNKGLRPWDVGYLTGEPKDEHIEEMQYYVENPSVQIPEGESLDQFHGRILPLLMEAIEIAEGNNEPVLIVGHSSIIYALGEAVNGDPKSVLVKPGGVVELYVQDGVLGAAAIFKPGKDDTSFHVNKTHVTPS
jgi:broad specificity phosphatase PhoE